MHRVAECVAALIAEFNELGVGLQVDSDSRRCHTLNLPYRLYSVYKISTPRTSGTCDVDDSDEGLTVEMVVGSVLSLPLSIRRRVETAFRGGLCLLAEAA